MLTMTCGGGDGAERNQDGTTGAIDDAFGVGLSSTVVYCSAAPLYALRMCTNGKWHRIHAEGSFVIPSCPAR